MATAVVLMFDFDGKGQLTEVLHRLAAEPIGLHDLGLISAHAVTDTYATSVLETVFLGLATGHGK